MSTEQRRAHSRAAALFSCPLRKRVDRYAAGRAPNRARIEARLAGEVSGLHSTITLAVCLLWGAVASNAFGGSIREEVEADWRRQDECWIRQIRQPGTVRFVETTLRWPGVKPAERLRVPRTAAPRLDGRLDDACWQRAARVPARAKGGPVFLLCHDGRRFYVGVSLPTAAENRFRGHSTARDAAGAVDGVKNGRYAFHTGLEPNPWWQVDLGKSQTIEKVVVYNRLDYAPGLHNADNLMILTSDDGRAWTHVYHNKGKFFGGVGRGKPLEVHFPGGSAKNAKPEVRARFVRLQVDSKRPIFFHLDEVEIYAAGDPKKNIALHRPAAQSSLSQWSRGRQGGHLFRLGRAPVALQGGSPPGVTIHGAPAGKDRAGIAREGGRTVVEVAFPLGAGGFPAEFRPPDGKPIPIASGEWQVVWDREAKLGFGRNRLTVELRSAGALDPPVELTVESVVFTPIRPERRIVFQDKLTRAKETQVEFQLAHEGPAALIVSARQGKATVGDGVTYFVEPVAGTLRRADTLLAEFGAPPPKALADLRRRAKALAERERTQGPDPDARAKLYLEARWLAREVAFANPLLAFERLLLVKRFTQETYPDVCLNHMPWCSRPGGDLCILSPPPGETRAVSPRGRPKVRNVLRGALGPGHVHGMDLRWDAGAIVFGYAKAKTNQPPAGWRDRRTSFRLRRTEEPTHLFEIGIDGSGLRQLTRGEWSDLDPTYLPNGDIAFASERCGYSLQCNEYDKDETSCNVYVMRPDGSGIRRLSVTKDGDYLPHALADGTIAYTRWEYQERGWAHIQSIWTLRPDGRFADALFKQHMNNPWALEDMRSIPRCGSLVAVATGHHTLAAGPVVIVSPRVGMNNADGIEIITPGVLPPEGGMSGRTVATGGVVGAGGFYMTPWPLSDKHFLVSYSYCDGRLTGLGSEVDAAGYALYLIDVHGTKELIYRDPKISCFVPIPLRPRPRPPVLTGLTEPREPFAVCALSDVARGVEGVKPEAIRYLRISQRLAWPYCNRYGGQRYERDAKAVMINWTPARVIGTVPVEADGSAHFRVPVDTPVYFQILDADHKELRRMRSFISFQPGEIRACSGCHETWAKAPPAGRVPMALRREPSVPVPPPWGDRAISFLRDVQPVFDRHCVRCHGGLKPAGGLDYSGGLTARYNRAYDTILARRLVSRSNVGDDAKITPPLAFGSHKSKLIHVLAAAAHRKRVKLPREDLLRLVIWIDANAPYHDGFLNKRPQTPPYDLAADRGLTAKIAGLHAKRCGPCHKAADVSRIDWIDLRDPRRSLFLTAPLAKAAGGTARCKRPAYPDRSDPDYQALVRLVTAAVAEAWQRPRRDLKALSAERPTVGLRPGHK